MISKELLSEVLGYEVEIRGFKDKFIPANFEYIKDMIDVKAINIYELAHKCKEWAYTKCNYTLESTSNPFGGFCKIEIYEIDIGKAYNKPDDVYRGTNEPEAIFKACQWILENKEGI